MSPLLFVLKDGKILVCNNKVYAGANKLDLTKDTVYVHPASKQCNYSVDLSNYATKAELDALPKVARPIASGNVSENQSIKIPGATYVVMNFSTTGSTRVSPTEATIALGSAVGVNMQSGNSGWGYSIQFYLIDDIPTLSCGYSGSGTANNVYTAYTQ